MGVNKKYLPIKAHYFFFLGSMSPVLPFLMVAARQIGIPVIFTGTIGSLVLILTVILKPLIGSAADAFPKFRKAIFILIITMMIVSLISIDLLPKLYGDRIDLALEIPLGYSLQGNSDIYNFTHLYSEEIPNSGCYVEEAWDCAISCQNDTDCQIGQISSVTYNESLSLNLSHLVYDVGKYQLGSAQNVSMLNLSCTGGILTGPSCRSLWTNGVFLGFFVLYTIGNISYVISNSISDAICVDLVGKDGDYGNQRAWGTVGWGLMGPISGLLIDWMSGEAIEKDYTPAFAILLIFGAIDILVALAKLDVPRFKTESGVWATVLPLFKKPQITLFLLFTIFNGAFDGVVALYIFVMQEDMAKGTQLMLHMKFLQGLTIFIQCAIEAPFMWVFSWFETRLGARRLTSLSFFLYIFRLFSLSLIGSYGPVWGTLVSEMFFNGACYGLGYTAVVVYAGQIAPHGTSATMQSIANLCYESFGYALAAVLGGILYTQVGGPGLYCIFGGMALCIFILHFLALIIFKDEMYEKAATKEENGDETSNNKYLTSPHDEIPSKNDENPPRVA